MEQFKSESEENVMSHSKETVLVDSVKLRKEFENRGLSISDVGRLFGRTSSYLSHKLTIPVGSINDSDVLLFKHLMDIDVLADFAPVTDVSTENTTSDVEAEFDEENNSDSDVVWKDVKFMFDEAQIDSLVEKLYDVMYRAVFNATKDYWESCDRNSEEVNDVNG